MLSGSYTLLNEKMFTLCFAEMPFYIVEFKKRGKQPAGKAFLERIFVLTSKNEHGLFLDFSIWFCCFDRDDIQQVVYIGFAAKR